MATIALVLGSFAGLITAVTGWVFFDWSIAYAFFVYVFGGVLSLGICTTAMMFTPETDE
ncbi:hypothetical protein [Primorskyibacter sedentarius]|uniref:hypothetical protein n=1 Tax=Primorskyibacter sedentarius TaxID=745311 RepID=UPI003EB80F32